VKSSLLTCAARRGCLLICAALLLSLLPAEATIDASVQMILGNPSGATTNSSNHSHYLIQRTVEAIDYNDALGVANWASWDLTWSDFNPSTGRTGSYAADTTLPAGFYQVAPGDYSNTSNYDRGHMCPSGDRTDNETDNQLVFYLSNFIPQAADNNQGTWESFETYCRSLASSNELLITCGPSGFNGNWLPSGKVAIPQYVWKIVVVVPTNNSVSVLDRINTSTRVIALKTPNTNGLSRSIAWQTFVTSVNQIQNDTGFTFFTALPTDIATVLRAKVDGQVVPAPDIASFAPTAGTTGTPVILTGTNFSSVSSVSFNGVSADFTVNSTTQITANVPAGATTGPLSVTSPGGTATSAGSFTITTVSAPDLAVAITHTGNFTQGDPSDIYTLVVTNVGSAAASGTVTLTDSLPAGLTATALSGTGWTVNLATLTCTRSDSLAAGAGYSPITLTVKVSTGAAASVTNVASLSGGGDSLLANNSASDPTTILAAGAPIVATGTPSMVANTTATLTGTVNPNNQAESAWFEYGLTTSYGTTGPISGTLTGATAQPVSSTLASLSPGTTYHFRLTATNLLGAAAGQDQTFTTGSGAGSGITTLAGWDMSPMTGGNGNFGPSPLAPTTNAANLTVGGLTRGTGVTTSNTGSARGWGGNGFTDGSADAAISANRYASFSSTANAGYKVSYTALSRFDYKRSPTGPTNGLVQYQIGTGTFNNLATVSYIPGTNSGGASLGPIDLTSIIALQNVSPGTAVTFRIVNWGATGSSGTWYIFDVANNTNTDLEIQGSVSPISLLPIQAWRLQWFATTNNSGLAADDVVLTSDGLPNLVKYALGLDPLVAATNPVVGDIASGFLRLTAPRNSNATDISFWVEATDNVRTGWSTNGVVDQTTTTQFQAHDGTPVSSAPERFLRLRVSRP
jgi:DNA/RNA endonuclease G (NUC1)